MKYTEKETQKGKKQKVQKSKRCELVKSNNRISKKSKVQKSKRCEIEKSNNGIIQKSIRSKDVT